MRWTRILICIEISCFNYENSITKREIKKYPMKIVWNEVKHDEFTSVSIDVEMNQYFEWEWDGRSRDNYEIEYVKTMKWNEKRTIWWLFHHVIKWFLNTHFHSLHSHFKFEHQSDIVQWIVINIQRYMKKIRRKTNSVTIDFISTIENF